MITRNIYFLIHDYYDIHNVEMMLVVDIDRVVDVEMMMMVVVVVVVVVVHKDQSFVDIVYQVLVLIDHVVLELVEKVVQLEDYILQHHHIEIDKVMVVAVEQEMDNLLELD